MKTTVPIDIRKQFESALGSEDEIWALSSSRNRTGDPGETWVVATKTRLLVGDRGFGGPVALREIRLRDITGVDVEGGSYGAGRAVILGKTGAIDSVCFSSLERDECSQLGRRIQERKAEVPVESPRVLGERGTRRTSRKRASAPPPLAAPVETPPAALPGRRPEIPPRRDPVPRAGAFDLFVDRPFAIPGQALTGVLRLCWPEAKPVRGVRFYFHGRERTHAQVGSGKSSKTVSSVKTWADLMIGCWGKDQPLGFFGSIGDAMSINTWEALPAGEHLWPFEFPIPEGAPAAYAGSNVDVTWQLRAQVDIPRGFDLTQNWGVRVIPPIPPAVTAAHQKHSRSVVLEGWVEAGPAGPGETVRGRFRVGNPQGKTIRTAHVELVRLEHAVASGHARNSVVVESSLKFPGRQLGEDPIGFELRLPDSYCPWSGQYSSLTYGVRVWLDVAWAFDVEVFLPTV